MAAIATCRPYIDLSEGRAFAQQVALLGEEIAAAGITVVSGWVGRDDGAVLVELSGRTKGRAVRERLAVVADVEGGRIPAVLAGMGAADILRGRLHRCGLVPANSWIAPDRFVASRAAGARVVAMA